MDTYDRFTIREAINNAVMHTDYRKGQTIDISEIRNDRIIFVNFGSFIPDSVRSAVLSGRRSGIYRNPLLMDTMFRFDLVDCIGYGMKKMFLSQVKRGFPLPEYRITDSEAEMTLTGHPISEAYDHILYKNPDLPLEVVFPPDFIMLYSIS